MALRAHLLFLRKSSLTVFRRSSYIGKSEFEKQQILQRCNQDLHLSSTSYYPKAKDIPLPTNIEDINAIETGRFSPQRARDITGDVILTQNSSSKSVLKEETASDSLVQSYDCTGTISLNSAMQTNVPDPYTAKGKASSHLNMPGGEWGRSDKYVAQDLQNSHYTNVKENDLGKSPATTIQGNKGTYSDRIVFQALGPDFQLRHFSSGTASPLNSESNPKKEDKISALKKAITHYGSTVIVFHVGISLISLGGFYLAVTSGIDMTSVFSFVDLPSEVAGEVGAFVIAYAIHKIFAPVRLSITLFSTPYIVRYLRKVGFLAPPQNKPQNKI